jgi:tetratricopeptide (TPR) repeat protein
VKLSADPSANNGFLWHKLALAYSYAGHGSKAATTYLHAAQHVSPEQALLYERAATSQLLCCGRFAEGEALLLRVLERLGLSVPSSDAGLYAALGWERARMAVRGLSYTPRQPSQQPFGERYAAALYAMLSMETAVYSPLRAALFQARSLRMVLELGDEEGVARVLCATATMESVGASESARLRSEALLSRAEAIANTIDSATARTNISTARAICAFLTGRIAESIDLCEQAEHLLRTASGDSEYHHRFTLASARIGALLQIGNYSRAEAELQKYLKEARATENVNAELHISMAQAWADSNADRAHAALSRLDKQREMLPAQGFGLLHVLHMIAVLRIGCATGKYDWALDTTRAHWQMFQHSVVRRSDSFSMFGFEAHARLLICRATRDKQPRKLWSELAPHRKALKKAQHAYAPGELLRIEARTRFLSGDKQAALQLLAESISSFEQAGARDQAARDRYALGKLLGDEAGEQMMQSALTALRERGVAAPLRQLFGYYPELVGDPETL